ncbi:MAG TPA: hypothetical protein PK239_00205 [Chitinophagales bacterium]|nr:hypothetical protein [Chitinophagales bacterium]HRK25683.1 hypothetical protein [Chitinophagales bacterium]
MKKLLLAIVMLGFLQACGGESGKPAEQTKTEETAPATTTTTETPAATDTSAAAKDTTGGGPK